jgi:hypothetical protein
VRSGIWVVNRACAVWHAMPDKAGLSTSIQTH